ncbi:MAG: 3-isopropylmalate dehydrogenase [Oscillospiraceae bacterium]|nr:3-isopropylmalate dehydrogenase [Oscillospiraceae bacterium]
MDYNIALIKGDGIGPEIITQAVNVLEITGKKYGHKFNFKCSLLGGCAIDETGVPLPQETIDECLKSDSVLLGAVGGPKWESLPGNLRPEAGLLGLRSAMKLYANIRPAFLFEPLKAVCPLRQGIAEKGIDMIIVRELTGGIYFGKRGRRVTKNGTEAFDTEVYNETEIKRTAKIAFETAMTRRKKLVSIDKANVLESSRLWRESVHSMSLEYPEVELKDMLVDNAAMQLVRDPSQFDVVLASNIFGDILSDEAAMITGSIGMLASASLGNGKRGLYEPIHGSAPDIAGQNKSNPTAAILSAAMMLEYSFGLRRESTAIREAVNKVLRAGIRTFDIKGRDTEQIVGTVQMGELICREINGI